MQFLSLSLSLYHPKKINQPHNGEEGFQKNVFEDYYFYFCQGMKIPILPLTTSSLQQQKSFWTRGISVVEQGEAKTSPNKKFLPYNLL